MKNNFVIGPIGSKTAVWEPVTNQYILTESVVAEFIKEFGKDNFQDIDVKMLEELPDTFAEYIKNSADKLSALTQGNKEAHFENVSCIVPENTDFSSYRIKYYRFNKTIIEIGFQSAELEILVHPKIEHLEIHEVKNPTHKISVCISQKTIFLEIDGKWVGKWSLENEHYFSGMLLMKLLEYNYSSFNDKWLGVFHAAGVASGENCILFAGNSGSGKSTLSAILMSAGFDVLADDFLPVESETGLVCRFPVAISIKSGAVETLAGDFPKLRELKEYNYPFSNKKVRYLPVDPTNIAGADKVGCRAIVFINYNPNCSFKLSKVSAEEAFQKIVPDSWIHPSEKNARFFLQWFSKLEYYNLTYSDNHEVILQINKLFQSFVKQHNEKHESTVR